MAQYTKIAPTYEKSGTGVNDGAAPLDVLESKHPWHVLLLWHISRQERIDCLHVPWWWPPVEEGQSRLSRTPCQSLA